MNTEELDYRTRRILKSISRLEYALNHVKEMCQTGCLVDDPHGHANVSIVGDFIIVDLHPELSDDRAP